MEPHKTHTDHGWVIRIRLRIRHCALKDSLLKDHKRYQITAFNLYFIFKISNIILLPNYPTIWKSIGLSSISRSIIFLFTSGIHVHVTFWFYLLKHAKPQKQLIG